MRDDPLGRATAVALDYLAGIVLLIALGALWTVGAAYAITLGIVIVCSLVFALFR